MSESTRPEGNNRPSDEERRAAAVFFAGKDPHTLVGFLAKLGRVGLDDANAELYAVEAIDEGFTGRPGDYATYVQLAMAHEDPFVRSVGYESYSRVDTSLVVPLFQAYINDSDPELAQTGRGRLRDVLAEFPADPRISMDAFYALVESLYEAEQRAAEQPAL